MGWPNDRTLQPNACNLQVLSAGLNQPQPSDSVVSNIDTIVSMAQDNDAFIDKMTAVARLMGHLALKTRLPVF